MNSTQKRAFALLRDGNVKERAHRMALASWILCRDVTTFSDMSDVEYGLLVDVLAGWQRQDRLVEECGKFGAG